MDINLECIYCTIKKADSLFSQYNENEEEKIKFMKNVFKIVSTFSENDTSPYLNALILRELNSILGFDDIYFDIKKEYNKFIMSMEDEIFEEIQNSEDRILAGLKYAMAGNFIDFGAMDEVDICKLKEIIKSAGYQKIDIQEYKEFLDELEKAENIVYILDNAGEIVFDKMFIKIIKEVYPDIEIDAIVRGKPVYNDVTMTDAREVGLCEVVNVIENGTDIPGTQLNKINLKAKKAIDRADLIIAKGQGNFETLAGCGKNIFYIFLCKCNLFTERFNLEKFKGVFINEKSVMGA